MKNREDLARLGCAVIHVDKGKLIVKEREARYVTLLKRVFEHKYAGGFHRGAPCFQRFLRRLPTDLVPYVDAEVTTNHACRLPRRSRRVNEDFASNQALGRVLPTRQLR